MQQKKQNKTTSVTWSDHCSWHVIGQIILNVQVHSCRRVWGMHALRCGYVGQPQQLPAWAARLVALLPWVYSVCMCCFYSAISVPHAACSVTFDFLPPLFAGRSLWEREDALSKVSEVSLREHGSSILTVRMPSIFTTWIQQIRMYLWYDVWIPTGHIYTYI